MVRLTIEPPKFRYEQLVPSASSADAMRVIETWLRDEGGKAKKSRPPTFLRAKHGRRRMSWGWEPDAPKWLDFDLAAAASEVHVKVTVYPSLNSQRGAVERPELARANYGQALASLWGRFSPELGQQAQLEPALMLNWERQLRDAERAVRNGMVATIFGATGVVLLLLIVFGTGTVLNRAEGRIFALVANAVWLYGIFNWIGGRKQKREALKFLRTLRSAGSDRPR